MLLIVRDKLTKRIMLHLHLVGNPSRGGIVETGDRLRQPADLEGPFDPPDGAVAPLAQFGHPIAHLPAQRVELVPVDRAVLVLLPDRFAQPVVFILAPVEHAVGPVAQVGRIVAVGIDFRTEQVVAAGQRRSAADGSPQKMPC